MSPNHEPEDRALKNVEELFKTIIATSGIMLTLLWGLTQRNINICIHPIVFYSSFPFIVSIIVSFLGNQFIVSKLQDKSRDITGSGSVPICFLIAWLSFVLGCVLLSVAIFKVTFCHV